MPRYRNEIPNLNKAYFICDTAWGFVCEQANTYKVGKFLNALPFQNLVDTRPIQYKEMDEERLKSNLLPYWDVEERKFRHNIALSLTSIQEYEKVSKKFGITRANIRGNYLGGYKNEENMVSAIINAYGFGFLNYV